MWFSIPRKLAATTLPRHRLGRWVGAGLLTILVNRPATLVYLLTLETHLPLAPVSLTPSEREVCSTHALSSSVCQHAVQIRRLLVRIVSVASQAEPVPFLVVAGDHSPPFFRPQNRSTYSRSTVPLLVARPR